MHIDFDKIRIFQPDPASKYIIIDETCSFDPGYLLKSGKWTHNRNDLYDCFTLFGERHIQGFWEKQEALQALLDWTQTLPKEQQDEAFAVYVRERMRAWT